MCSQNRRQAANELILYATILSIFISKDLTACEMNILGNFFEVLGQNLETLSAYVNGCDSGLNGNGNNNMPLIPPNSF